MNGSNALLLVVIFVIFAVMVGHTVNNLSNDYQREYGIADPLKYPKEDQYVIVVKDNFDVFMGIYHVKERNWSRKRSSDTCAVAESKIVGLTNALNNKHQGLMFFAVKTKDVSEFIKELKK